MDNTVWGTIVGGAIGFLASVLPKIFEILESQYLHKQKQEAQAQQIDAASKGITVSSSGNAKILVPVEGEVFAPGIPADADEIGDAEVATALPVQIDPSEGYWPRLWGTLRLAVRPLVTFGLFGLFLFVKIKGFYQGMLVDQTPITELLPVVWNESTESLFAAVLAFWFGSRAFEKSRALLGKQE